MFQNFLPAVAFEMYEEQAAVSAGWESLPGDSEEEEEGQHRCWSQMVWAQSHPDPWQVFKLYRFTKWVWYYLCHGIT